MTTDLRRRSATSRGLALSAAAIVYLLSSGADAGPPEVLDCGAKITADDGKVTLGGDIGPCGIDDSPALIIVGPVKVNFNGHKLICDDDIPEDESTTGIEVSGYGAKIKNGIVKNCGDGIRLVGDEDPEDDQSSGHHKIIRMVVKSNQDKVGDRAFRVDSDNNYLALDVARRFNGEGFRIEGKRNRLIRNIAIRNLNHGFRVEGDDNELTRNLAHRVGSQEEGGEGFRIEGSGNRLVKNIALKSQDEGYRIREGQNNTLIHNLAQGNGVSEGEAGIRIEGSNNSLYKNAFLGNAGDGILVKEDAENPDRDGTSNSIERNTSRDNGGTDLVDEHMTPPCDDNEWVRNRFGTASQGCIQ